MDNGVGKRLSRALLITWIVVTNLSVCIALGIGFVEGYARSDLFVVWHYIQHHPWPIVIIFALLSLGVLALVSLRVALLIHSAIFFCFAFLLFRGLHLNDGDSAFVLVFLVAATLIALASLLSTTRVDNRTARE